jgi:hypothetical protein
MTPAEISRKGLSLVLSSPTLMISELAWRWAFAVGASGILLSYSSILRDAISLSAADQNALLSSDPMQMIAVGSRIMAAALPIFIQTAVSALPKIAIVWWLCITIGRSPMLRQIALFSASKPVAANARFWTSMAIVNAVRVLLLLIVLSGFLGASRMAESALGTDIDHPRILVAMLVFFLVLSTGILIYLLANFVAALAPLFVVQGRGALDSIADSLQLSMREKTTFGTIAAANATLRTVVAMVITGTTVLLLPMSRYLPQWLILALAGLLTVLYCAASDVLLVARTTAYAFVTLGAPEASELRPVGRSETSLYSPPPDLRS